MRALITDANADRALPAVRELRLASEPDEMRPTGLEGVIRRAVEADAVRRAVVLVDPPHRTADIGVVADRHAESACIRVVAVPIVGQIVVRGEVRELAEVIEPRQDAADRG